MIINIKKLAKKLRIGMTTVDYKLLGNGLSYDKESVNDIVNLFNNVNVDYKDKVVVSSKIIAIEKDFIIVRVNDKFDSVIKKSELKDIENIELGMLIDVFIEKLGDKKGQIVVSRTKGLIVRIWEEIFDSKKNNTILTINVKEKVVGGVIGEYKGVKVFVPISQIINCTNDNLDTFIGKDLEVIVVKINKVTCNVIAYKGTTQIPVSIGTITGQVTGLTVDPPANNNTTSASFKVKASTILTTKSGILTIPIVIDGKSFEKKFSWTLSNQGAKGDSGPEAVVTITPTAINWDTGIATLAATLRVNGVITTPTNYKWTKGTSNEELTANADHTLTVNDLNATYNCTVTW